MSSPPKQPTNSNNDQSQNPPPQMSVNYLLDEYEDDPSLRVFNNSNSSAQAPNVITGDYFDPTEQIHSANQEYIYDETDDVIENELEAELNAMLGNEQLYDYAEDEAIYSDAVQNAFANYENEYSKYWNQNEPNWDTFSSNEQDEMFDQMRECMLFMSQEYSTAEMPHNLIERTQESKLNPDAAEFRPSWSSAPISTDKDAIVVTSWIPCEAKKQEEEQKDF